MLRRLIGVRIAVHQVLDAGLVSAAESVAIGFAVVMGNRRMTELFAVFNTGLTVILVVLARAFNAIVKTLSMHALKFGGRSRPDFVAVVGRRTLLWVLRVRRGNAQKYSRCECC